MKRSLPKIAAVLAVLLGVAALAIPAWLCPSTTSNRVAPDAVLLVTDFLLGSRRVVEYKVRSGGEG